MGIQNNVPESKSIGALPDAGLQSEQKVSSVHKQLTAALVPKNALLESATERYLIAPPRKTLISQFALLLSVTALLIVFSFGALTYLFMPVWVYLGYCVYAYGKLCRLYGYSAVLITVLYGSFLILLLFIKSVVL